MASITYLKPEEALKAADNEQVLRGRQLLAAAQQYYDGEINEDDFTGYLCRYGHACMSRRIIRHEVAAMASETNVN